MNATRIIAAALVMIGAGLVHGGWTSRWKPSNAVAERAERIHALPVRIGDWTAEERPLSEAERVLAGAVGCLSRQYRNGATGEVVTMLLICGLPGDVAVHTPEVCYAGGGYEVSRPAPATIPRSGPTEPAGFFTATAARGGTSPSRLRILWSWNDGEGWQAPNEPRWTFAAAPVLSKLYVVREASDPEPADGRDFSLEVLDVLLPVLDRDVFSPPSSAPPAPAADRPVETPVAA